MRRIVAILLVLMLALMMVACGNENEKGQPEQDAQQSGQDVQQGEPSSSNAPSDGNPDDPNALQPVATAEPVVPCKEMTFSGLKLYIPEQWTGSEANGSFTAISNDYYNDLGSISVSRDSAVVPNLATDGELTQDQVVAALSGLIADSEIHITGIDNNATLAGYPAIKAYCETEIEELKMYMVLYVTASPDISNFLMAASSLNYADIATFENLFTYTVVG